MWNRVSEKYNSFTNKSNIQDKGGVYYFPNEETGITASSVCVYKDAYGQYQSQGKLKNGKQDGKQTLWGENGQIRSESNYKDGWKDGKWAGWLYVVQHSLWF